MNEALSYVSSFIYAAVLAGTPLLFGTLGEIITEKAGNLNLGVEGMMYMGAIMGFYAGYVTGSVALSLIAALAAGALGALIYAFLTVTLKANQNVTGLTLTIFGGGFANFIGENLILNSPTKSAVLSDAMKANLKSINIPLLSDIPYIGRMFFQYLCVSGHCAGHRGGLVSASYPQGAEPEGGGRKPGRGRRGRHQRDLVQVCAHPGGRRPVRPGRSVYRAHYLRRNLDV